MYRFRVSQWLLGLECEGEHFCPEEDSFPETPAGEPLQYRLDVTVQWSAGGMRRSKQYTTLILREIPFGERMRRQFLGAEDLTRSMPAGSEEKTP